MIGRQAAAAKTAGHKAAEPSLRSFFGRYFRASLVLICAGFSAIVLGWCVFAGVRFKSAVEQEFYRETGNISQILMADFDDDAATADAILGGLAGAIAPDQVSPSHEAELHKLLTGYALPPSMIGPAVLDRDGTLIASARSAEVPNLSFKDRNTFRVHADAPNESKLYISTPMRGPITNEWVIQFSRPLHDPTGAFDGVVLLSYRLAHFVSLYEKLKLSNGGLTGLVGKDGVVRIRSLNGVIGYGAPISRLPLVYDRALAGETSGTFYDRGGPDDETRIGAFAVSPTTPFYVTVGYDEGYLRARYIGFFYVLGLCWLVLTAAMTATVAFTHRLGQLSQQAQLEIVNSVLAERQKISADMHDSIGSSLAALLAYFAAEHVDLSEVRRRVGEILMELRFLVDSAEADNGDINLILGNVRHRLGGGLELAGIDFRWQAVELPQIEGLTARDALAIKLIMMEALTNVLHHSRAKSATLTARYEPAAATIAVVIADDGVGFDPAAAGGGRGLANMRKRATSISIGAALAVDSAPGRGTMVRLDLIVPAGLPAFSE